MFLGVRPFPQVWIVGGRRRRRWLCNQYRCLLFFYWKIYSSWPFLWSSVLDFQQVCWFNDFSKSSCQAWPMMVLEEAFSAAVQELWSQKYIFCSFQNLPISKTGRKVNDEGMGSAIPIKLPENGFPHFGESVVSWRILRWRVLSPGQCVKWPFWSFSPSMITDF